MIILRIYFFVGMMIAENRNRGGYIQFLKLFYSNDLNISFNFSKQIAENSILIKCSGIHNIILKDFPKTSKKL